MIYETPQLETERLVLKKGTLKDLQKVYEYDFTKLRDIAGEFVFEKYDPKKIEGWEIPEPETYDWVIYLKDTMEPIGNVTADREQQDIKAIELAFNTHPNHWRKGYTTEALIEIMRFLFNNGYENILCGYDEGNIKSKAIGEKLGFIPYKVKENAWVKNGIPITSYTSILSKERFNELYKINSK
jgi:ribosomal-protein-alanine N-acetyltransferase